MALRRTASKSKADPAAAPVNKTQAVKDYLAANPGAGPKAVSDALNAQGIDVKPNYVSIIKFQSKKKRRGKAKAAAGPSAAPAASSEGLSIELLVKAKKVAESLGGVEEARKAMDALAKLMG